MFTFLKAKAWNGAEWLFLLCITLVFVAAVYFWLHVCYTGTDHKKLDSTQLAGIDNVLSNYPDMDTSKLKNETEVTKKASLRSQREARDLLLFSFFQNEYDNHINKTRLKQLDQLLIGWDNKDVKLYFVNKELIVDDFFWFTGSRSYLEVLFWALIGVLISLIYYVSIANRQSLKVVGDDDVGAFDPAEISGQVSKMFYAPVSALVLVLGYNLLSGGNSKMTDISIGKGLLLFSFIAGFFSGRVMKFIDKLKDLVLPVSDDGAATTKTSDGSAIQTFTDVTVELQLAPDVLQAADAADIIEGGFNSAVVTLKPQTGDLITLAKPADDQSASFTGNQVPNGNYILQGVMAFKKNDTIVNLAANKTIEVGDTSKDFQLLLDKTTNAG